MLSAPHPAPSPAFLCMHAFSICYTARPARRSVTDRDQKRLLRKTIGLLTMHACCFYLLNCLFPARRSVTHRDYTQSRFWIRWEASGSLLCMHALSIYLLNRLLLARRSVTDRDSRRNAFWSGGKPSASFLSKHERSLNLVHCVLPARLFPHKRLSVRCETLPPRDILPQLPFPNHNTPPSWSYHSY